MAVKTYTNTRTGRQVTVNADYLPESLKARLVNPVEPEKPKAIIAMEKGKAKKEVNND